MAQHGWWVAVAAVMAAMTAPTAGTAAARPATDTDTDVRRLVERFEAARAAYDPVALAVTLAPEFEEISPVGAVDPRAAVLDFYAPAQKRAVPPMTVDELGVRMLGDTALVTERVAFAPPGATTTRAIRVRYVARRSGRDWKLVSAQYTPMPPAR